MTPPGVSHQRRLGRRGSLKRCGLWPRFSFSIFRVRAAVRKKEILEDEVAFAFWKLSAAHPTGHFMRFRTGFDFDDLIERAAGWAVKKLIGAMSAAQS
jgi:hypothetical protein